MIHMTPALFKPTSVLMIDDDILLAKGIKNSFKNNIKSKFSYHRFLTQETEEELDKNYQDILSFNRMSIKDINSHFDNCNVFSTIILDHHMLPKTGLQIAQELKNPFVQKIMISNLLGEKEALNALNEGLINFYLCKMDNNFMANLAKAITISQQKFFTSISKLMPNYSEVDNPLLQDGSKKIFEDIKTKYNLEHYEVAENFRTFKFFNDANTKTLTLQFISEAELDELLNSYQAESAPQNILEIIKTGAMLPYFDDGHVENGEHWLKHLKPAKKFIGKQKYFYITHEEEENGTN